MVSEIYLDHNATTPCAPEVVAAMLPFFREECGNAASPHTMGKRAHSAVSSARETVARTVGCDANEIVFTSGATESNNIVLMGLSAGTPTRTKLVTTTIEHKSVLEPCRQLSFAGWKVLGIPVNGDCVVDLEAAAELIDEDTLLVSVQGANNEIGTLQPVRQIADIAHAKGALVHCDAVQLLGKVPVPVDELGVDFASFSGHKIYGPKGIGFLFVRRGEPWKALRPLFYGGGQEDNLRPGTHNVPGIVGIGEACRLVGKRLAEDESRISKLRDSLESAIVQSIPGSRINGRRAPRLPGTLSVTIPGVLASMLIANTPQLCIGEGSACNSGALEPSHVLVAMGLSRTDADSTIRISLGRDNSTTDIVVAADRLALAAMELLTEMDAG